MNRFTRLKEHKDLPDEKRQTRASGGSGGWVWALTAKIILIAVLIFGAHSIRVVYKAKTEDLNKEARRIDAQIRAIKHETMNLRNRKAQLSARPYIQKKTAKLGLRAADYSQVQHVALLQEPKYVPGRTPADYAEAPAGKEARPYSVTAGEKKKDGRKDNAKVAAVF